MTTAPRHARPSRWARFTAALAVPSTHVAERAEIERIRTRIAALKARIEDSP